MSGPPPYNVGIVGAGLSATVFHAPFITTNRSFRLTKFLRNRSDPVPGYTDVPVVTDTEAFFGDKDLHVAVITTPSGTHYDLATKALKAGKHVVVEKPLCVTSREAEQLCQLAKSTKLVLAVYHNRRWDGDFLTASRLIKEGTLGRVVEFESHFDRYRAEMKPGAWREKDLPGSGVLYDLGSHLLDQALVLFGPPEAITAHVLAQRQLKTTSVDDAFTLMLHYPSLTAILRATMLAKVPGPRFIIHGMKGNYTKHGLDPQEGQLRAGMLPTASSYGIEPPDAYGSLHAELAGGLSVTGKVETLKGRYEQFYENVAQALEAGDVGKLEVQPEQAAMVIKLIELAKQSADQGSTVRL